MSAIFAPLAALCVAMLFDSPALAQERRVALPIGNTPYVHGSVPRNAGNDAEELQTRLQRLGFGVRLVPSQGAADRRVALWDLSDGSSGIDVALFSLVDHGLEAGQVALAQKPALPRSAPAALGLAFL